MTFKYEIRRIRNCRSVQVISIVVGALGTVSRGFIMWLKQLRMPFYMELLQRITVLGSGLILGKVLEKEVGIPNGSELCKSVHFYERPPIARSLKF